MLLNPKDLETEISYTSQVFLVNHNKKNKYCTNLLGILSKTELNNWANNTSYGMNITWKS